MTALLPFAALLRRETVDVLRRKRSVAPIAFLIVAAIAAVTFNLMEGTINLSALSIWSNTYFRMMATLLFVATALFVPGIAGNTVIAELERETVEMLALTYLGPARFIAAKLLASVAYILFLIVGVFPVIGIAYFQVGIDIALITKCLALILISALSLASAGICASCLASRRSTAIAGAYALGLCVMGGPYVLAAAAALFMAPPHISYNMLNLSISFFPSMYFYALAVDKLTNLPITTLKFEPFVVQCLVQSTFAVTFFAVSVWRMRDRWQNPRIAVSTTPLSAGPPGQTQCTHAGQTYFGPFERQLAIVELQTTLDFGGRLGRRLGRLVSGISILATLALLVAFLNSPAGYLAALHGWLMLQLALWPLLVLPFMVTLLCSDRERDTLDALRMCLESPYAIMRGKLRAACHCGVRMFTAILPAQLALLALTGITYMEKANLWGRVRIPFPDVRMVLIADATLVLEFVLAGAAALLGAALGRRIISSLAIALFAISIVLFGAYTSLALLDGLGFSIHYHSLPRGAWQPVSVASPITAFGNIANSIRWDRQYFGVWNTSMALMGVFSVCLIAASANIFVRRYFKE
jgi:ABC-type transport system involved in multi-copper enzyme maturation permease subunit